MQNKILILLIVSLSGYLPIAFAEEINVTDADTVWNLTLDNATNVSRLVGEPGVMVVKYADAISYQPLENAASVNHLVGEPGVMVVKYADAISYQPLENAASVNHLVGEPGVMVVKYADAISYQPLENAASVGRLVGEPGVMVVKYADAISYETFDNPISTPPQSISNLSLQSAGTTWLNFTWLNPHDLYFSHVMLYLNGSFLTNVSAPQNYYNFTGLQPDTIYKLGTHTVDSSGNVNETWVNATARTLPSGAVPPVAVCGHDKIKCENVDAPVQFNGSSSYDPDGAVISYYWIFGDGTNGTGAALKHTYTSYKWNGSAYLPFMVNLTVTDNSGLMNTTHQKVVIWIAGDANGDGIVNIIDASIVGLRWNVQDSCADLNNDGKVNIIDASIIGLNWGKSA